MNRRLILVSMLALGALGYCVLNFHQTSAAQPGSPVMPFAGSTEQRVEMLAELKEIKELLKEQNALLRSGEAKVTLVIPALPKAGEAPKEEAPQQE